MAAAASPQVATPSARAAFRFSHRLRVRWAEVDMQGIVFNAHYLTWFDVALTEYWRTIGCPYPASFLDRGADTFVVKATIEYHNAARFDDEVDVVARVARIGRSSLTCPLQIWRADQHLISGEVVYVVADPQTRKSIVVPGFLRDAILAFEATPPEQGVTGAA